MPLPDLQAVAEVERQANNALVNLNVVLLTVERMGGSLKGEDVSAILKEAPALLAGLKDLVASMKCP